AAPGQEHGFVHMSQLFKCAPAGAEPRPGAGLKATRRNGRSLVIDIHCHLAVPAADELMRPHMAGQLSIHTFSSPATDQANREQFGQIGRKLDVIDERIADMDRLGVDVQFISPVPTQYYYFPEGDLGRDASLIVNDAIAAADVRHPDLISLI